MFTAAMLASLLLLPAADPEKVRLADDFATDTLKNYKPFSPRSSARR